MTQLRWWCIFILKLLGTVAVVLLAFAGLRATVHDPEYTSYLLLVLAALLFAFRFMKSEATGGAFGFFSMLVVGWMLGAICSWFASEALKIFFGAPSTFSNFSVGIAVLAMCISFDVFRGEPRTTQSRRSGWFSGGAEIAIGAQIASSWFAVFWLNSFFQ